MDSLLYIGAGDDEDGESEGEEEEGKAMVSVEAASGSALDFAAIQRAGYSGASADLRQTATYKRLDEEAKEAVEREAAAKEQAAEEAAAAEAIRLAAEKELLDPKAIDKRLGYEKRFDKTKEDFRAKEKRKRAMGQQSSGSDWVQEEKRRLRQGMTGNYDS